ncbi:MAG: RNA polymerase sigma factor [Bacillota bacterium]
MKSGTEPDLDQVYVRHVGPVRNYLYHLSGCRDLAEDLVHEVFYRAMRQLVLGVRVRHVSAWLYRIARNLYLDHLKRRRLEETPLDALDAHAVDELAYRAGKLVGPPGPPLVVVAGWAGVWFLSAPAPPGMYLARFTGSQILVNGRAGFIIPFLWVPEYPGQRPPELWTVEIPCVGGRGLTLKVAGVTLEGWTYGPLRYQRGWIHAYQQEGVLTRFGDGFWSFYPKEPPLDPLWDDEGLPYITRRARAVTIIARGGPNPGHHQ